MAWVSKKELRRQIEELKNSQPSIIVHQAAKRKPNSYETEIRALKDYIAVTQGVK